MKDRKSKYIHAKRNEKTGRSPFAMRIKFQGPGPQGFNAVKDWGTGPNFPGSEIYSELKAYSMNGGQVGENIVGLAACAASVIAMGGDRVRIYPVGQIYDTQCSNL